MVMVAPALNGMVVMPTPALSCLGSGISTALHALLCSHMENTGFREGKGWEGERRDTRSGGSRLTLGDCHHLKNWSLYLEL